MLRSIFLAIFAFVSLHADIKHIYPTEALLKSGIKIIDIRTESEWRQTGIIPGSILITFFDEQGRYDADRFLQFLDSYVKKGEEFAIICRTGNRTKAVSGFLDEQGYRVIDLEGGITYLIQNGYVTVPYKK